METLLIALVSALILLLVFLVWHAGRKVPRAVYRQAEHDKNQARIDLAKALERERLSADLLRKTEGLLDGERRERAVVERTLESANASLLAQQEKFREQKEELSGLREQFRLEFQHMANTILEEKTQKFTDTNHRHIGQILDPLREKIKTFEEKVEQTYRHEAAERNALKGTVEQLMQQSRLMTMEANSLTKALKGDTKKQGNWGEFILERVLERSGLVKGSEYKLQSVFRDSDARKIPDAVVLLPEDKHLVIDSKISLTAYEKWANATNEQEEHLSLKQHIQSVENHVRELSAKNYQALYGIHSPDFVFLFMPIEPAFNVAVREKPDLFADAWDRKVVIAGPSTLLATLRTVAGIWVQERQTRNVLKIAHEAGALYDKFVGFLNDMEQLKSHLHKAVEKQEEAMKKLTHGQGNVTKRIENLREMGAKANKQIDGKYLSN